jgi:hypothetical protein
MKRFFRERERERALNLKCVSLALLAAILSAIRAI